VNGYELEPTESGLKIPYPRSPFGLEFDDSSLTVETASFGRERGRWRSIRWQPGQDSHG